MVHSSGGGVRARALCYVVSRNKSGEAVQSQRVTVSASRASAIPRATMIEKKATANLARRSK